MAHDANSMSDWLNYLSRDEVKTLKDLAAALPANPVVVNIGAGSGTSGLAFMESRTDIVLVTIDIQKGAHPTGSLESERAALEDAGLYDPMRNFYIHGRSQEIAGTWTAWAKANLGAARTHADLVFVDGGHEYEECAADIQGWLPHLRKGGVLAVHDFEKEKLWAQRHPDEKITDEVRGKFIKPHSGVDQAVHELLLGKFPLAAHTDSLIAFANVPAEPVTPQPPKRKSTPKKPQSQE